MNMIQTFDFETNPVRTLLRGNEPWFVAADICRILDLTNPWQAVANLDDDEKDTVSNNDGIAAPQVQSLNIISESGFYSLIFTSRKPEAKRLRKWVTSDVLPSIRKTGSYTIPNLKVDDDDDLPALEHSRLWGQPVAKINAAARMISVASRIYGPEAARVLWEREKGLPKLSKFSIEALSGSAADDPVGCWRHMMRTAIGNGATLGQRFDLALHDHIIAKAMRGYGISIDPHEAPGSIAVAREHTFLKKLFTGTQWANDWHEALLLVPGARLSKGKVSYGTQSVKAVIISRHETAKLQAGML